MDNYAFGRRRRRAWFRRIGVSIRGTDSRTLQLQREWWTGFEDGMRNRQQVRVCAMFG